MKIFYKLATVALFSSIMIACGGEAKKEKTAATEEKAEETTEVKSEPQKLDIIAGESKVNWSGSVIGVYEHSGTVDVKEGYLTVNNGQITEGVFVADLTTMVATDDNSNPEEGKSADKLIEHLSSGDFFQVDSFPEATFVVKSHNAEAKTLTGELTIRGNTNEETVENVMINMEEGTASGELVVDRKEYDVAFTHPAKDVVIKDEMNLSVMLKM